MAEQVAEEPCKHDVAYHIGTQNSPKGIYASMELANCFDCRSTIVLTPEYRILPNTWLRQEDTEHPFYYHKRLEKIPLDELMSKTALSRLA